PDPNYAFEIQYIQQPDPLALGWLTAAGGTQATIHANLQPPDIDPLLQAGDYIDVNGGGRLYQGTKVDVSTPGWTVVTVAVAFPSTESSPEPPNSGATTPSNYRIFAQPRLKAGEEPQRLPPGTQINKSKSLINPRDVTQPGGPPVFYYEILFSPAGNVINQ